jgi:hypothetical protein
LGEELRILQDDRIVAKLVRQAPPNRSPREPGSAKGKILYMADDFDATPKEFREYMQ